MSLKLETTWAGLRDASGNFHQCLVELKVREKFRAVAAWTQRTAPNTNVWYHTFADTNPYAAPQNETNRGGDKHNRKLIVAMYLLNAAGTTYTALTAVADVATCHATSNSYVTDSGGSVVDVNVGGDPALMGDLVIEFWLYFSLGSNYQGVPVTFNGKDYRPYIMSGPTIARAASEPWAGTPVTGSGTIRLANPQLKGILGPFAAAAFDDTFETYIWVGATVKLLFGGDALAYAAYQTEWTGTVQDATWDDTGFSLQVSDVGEGLAKQLSLTRLTLLDFIAGSSKQTDKIVPVCYGACSRVQALLREESTLLFQVATHTCAAIERVFIGGKEVIPFAFARATGGVYGNSFYIQEIHRKLVIQDKQPVEVDLVGRVDSNYRAMLNPSDIAEHVLTNYAGYTTGDLDSTSFDDGRNLTASTFCALAITGPVSAKEVLDRLARAGIVYIYPTAAGVIVFEVWVPVRPDVTVDASLHEGQGATGAVRALTRGTQVVTYYTVETAREAVVSRPGAELGSEATVYTVTDPIAQTYTGRADRLGVTNTALESVECAKLLTERLSLLYSVPTPEYSFPSNKRVFDRNVNDILAVTRQRAPDSSNQGWSSRLMQITRIEITPTPPVGSVVYARDLETRITANYGTWKAAGSPTWTASTAAQRLLGGYWVDDSGYADAADDRSGVGYWG